MNYGTAEQEIVNRLNAFIADQGMQTFFEAALQPETEAEFRTFYANFTKSRVAVQYIDSSFNPSSSNGIIVQEEKPKFRLTYEARKLRGEGGLYNMQELVVHALLGWRLTNADRLYLVKYGMLEFEQNAWQPYHEFECKTLLSQKHDDYTDESFGGNLQSVSFNEQFSS